MCSLDEIFPLSSPFRSHYFNGEFWMKILRPKCRKAKHCLSTSLCIHEHLNKVTGIHFSTVCSLISSGDWKYGMRFGEGVLTYTNGAGYRGQWELDKVSALKERNLRTSSPGRPRELARRVKRAYTERFCDKQCEKEVELSLSLIPYWCLRRPIRLPLALD